MSTAHSVPWRTILVACWLVWPVGARILTVLLVLLGMGSAPCLAGGAMVEVTSFAGQYDTDRGWRPDVGIPSINAPVAEPAIAMGLANIDGAWLPELQLGAYPNFGRVFNPLRTPGDVHNAQEGLWNVFYTSPPPGYTFTQPLLLHDQAGDPHGLDRFILVVLATNTSTQDSQIRIAVTKYDGDLEAGICTFWINVNAASTHLKADASRVGMSSNAVLITVNTYPFAGGSFQGAALWVIAKEALYNDPSQASCPAFRATAWSGFHNADGTPAFTLTPAKSYVNSAVTYMLNTYYPQDAGANALTAWKVDTTIPTAASIVERTVATHTYFLPPDAEQLGTTTRIGVNAWGTRLFNAVYHTKGVWTVRTTGCTIDGLARSCLHWLQIDPVAATVLQEGTFGDTTGSHSYVYAPAIGVDAQGSVVIPFNASGPHYYVGMYYVGRHYTDAPNTLQPASPLQGGGGQGCYQRASSGNTVSTHSGVDWNPAFPSDFWITGAYVYGHDVHCNNDWATAVAAVSFTGAATSSAAAAP